MSYELHVPKRPGRTTLPSFILAGAVLALAAGEPRPAFGQATNASPQAPIGHRQPTARDVTPTLPPDQGVGTTPELQKSEQDVNQRIKSICRGC
jgi:hypothetical protein